MDRCLVFGNGAREHAIVRALKRAGAYVCAVMEKRNPGIEHDADEILVLPLEKQFREYQSYDYAIIGPEKPLAEGLADYLEEKGIPTIGPSQKLSRLESSKVYAREFLSKHKIKGNPRYKVCVTEDEVKQAIKEIGDFVVKPDGLTGGKGVKVWMEHLKTTEEAIEYASHLIRKEGKVLIEEKCIGKEFSLQAFVSGAHLSFMPLVRDFKRAYEGDTGPNTGSMGSCSRPDHMISYVPPEILEEAKSIMQETVKALSEEVGEYKGILYGQFMITNEKLVLIEYNVRFGDPEAINVLELLQTPLTTVCRNILDGKLEKVEFEKKATVVVYLVPEGYPEDPVRDEKIQVPHDLWDEVYFASVYKVEDQERKVQEIRTTGSRAIAVIGKAETLEKAREIAYQKVGGIEGKLRHRKDICPEA